MRYQFFPLYFLFSLRRGTTEEEASSVGGGKKPAQGKQLLVYQRELLIEQMLCKFSAESGRVAEGSSGSAVNLEATVVMS